MVMTNTVNLDWKGGMLFDSVAPEGNVLIESAEEFGGKGVGMRPKALMLTSLAGCSALDIVSLLEKMRAQVKDFKIEVTGELTDEHPKYYHKVHVIYKFYDSEFKKDKIEKAINLSVERYCGVMEMFRKFSEVTTEIQYITE